MKLSPLFLLLAVTASPAQESPPVELTTEGHIFRPAKLEATQERIDQLKVPKGFEVSVFARDLQAPRMLAVGKNGNVYVTRRDPHGDVLLLKSHDGVAGKPVTVANIPHVHGVVIRDGKIYLAAIRELYVADIHEDGTLGDPKKIVDDLPDAGQHPNRTLKFSPDGELYLSVGSTCNAAPEANKENATMLVVAADGNTRRIFASGLRNTIGFDWDPATKELWGMDHGIDWLGDEVQKEELNLLKEGKKYGWPFVYEDGKPYLQQDPKDPTGLDWKAYAAECENPVLTYAAHSAPMDLLFYRGTAFPDEYRKDAFVTFHGSWNRKDPRGYRVCRVKFDNGKPTGFEDFLTGFAIDGEKGQFGRPCGLAEMEDGSLLLSDDSGGMIYRISATKR